MIQFSKYEIAALEKNQQALELLCDYHDVQASMSDAMDFSDSCAYHEKRRKELKADIERLKSEEDD